MKRKLESAVPLNPIFAFLSAVECTVVLTVCQKWQKDLMRSGCWPRDYVRQRIATNRELLFEQVLDLTLKPARDRFQSWTLHQEPFGPWFSAFTLQKTSGAWARFLIEYDVRSSFLWMSMTRTHGMRSEHTRRRVWLGRCDVAATFRELLFGLALDVVRPWAYAKD
jgi:hypothetical protein